MEPTPIGARRINRPKHLSMERLDLQLTCIDRTGASDTSVLGRVLFRACGLDDPGELHLSVVGELYENFRVEQPGVPFEPALDIGPDFRVRARGQEIDPSLVSTPQTPGTFFATISASSFRYSEPTTPDRIHIPQT